MPKAIDKPIPSRSPDRECIPQIPRSTLPYKAKKVVPVKRITCFSYFSFLVCNQSHLLRNAKKMQSSLISKNKIHIKPLAKFNQIRVKVLRDNWRPFSKI